MVENAPPSKNSVNDDSMTGLLREVLRKTIQTLDNQLPAVVESYDRQANRARVRPLIQLVTTLGERVPREPIPSVPVLKLGGGGFFINFNLPPGSLGWLQASDRDISLFLQSLQEAAPNTRRLHSFEDSLFIPDIIDGFDISEEDSQAMVIQNTDGSVKMSLSDQRIALTAPQIVINVGGTTMTIDDGLLTLDGANQENSGDVTAAGTVTGETDVIGDGVSLSSHQHAAGTFVAGGDPVTGNSGDPI